MIWMLCPRFKSHIGLVSKLNYNRVDKGFPLEHNFATAEHTTGFSYLMAQVINMNIPTQFIIEKHS